MNFLDRKQELNRLLRLSALQRGGLAVLWGRRRIGKSALLQRWCSEAKGLYSVADQSVATVQRAVFAERVAEQFPSFADVVYPSWKSLFDALSQRARQKPWHGPLVLDEFPYWVESDASLPSTLQNWIDREKREGGILTAIAGSCQHMMQGLVLDADSPLYGRADEKMRLSPLDLFFIQEGLGLSNPLDCLKAYAVWGGIPRYWVAAERFGNRLEEALDDLVLDPLGVFHDEPAALLQSEIPSAMGLKPYLDVIGAGANRATEIAGRLGVPATALSRSLSRLIELGLVKREIPFGESEKNSKKSLYKVADPFCRLWFQVVAPRKSLLESAPPAIRRNAWKRQSQRIFSIEWEEASRRHVAVTQRLAGLVSPDDCWLPAGRWWHGEEPEWDVVSITESGSCALLGEVKWSEKPFTKKDVAFLANAIRTRPPPPSLPDQRIYALFLASVSADVSRTFDNVEIFTAKDILFVS